MMTLPQPLINPKTRLPTNNNLNTNHKTTTSTNLTRGHKEMNATVNEEEEETSEEEEDSNNPEKSATSGSMVYAHTTVQNAGNPP